MLEWQAESSLFTVRIRAKQWYWVYKFELKTVTDILSSPKNIGGNKWVASSPLDLQIADDYLHILQMRTQRKWIRNYWGDSMLKEIKPDRTHVTIGSHFSKTADTRKNSTYLIELDDFNFLSNDSVEVDDIVLNNVNTVSYLHHFLKSKELSWSSLPFFDKTPFSKLSVYNRDLQLYFEDRRNLLKGGKFLSDIILKKPYNKNCNIIYNHNTDLIETFRWIKKQQGPKMPFRIIKNPLNIVLPQNINDADLFRVRWSVDESAMVHKIAPHTYHWTFKQKRYKRRKSIVIRYRFYRDANGKLTTKVKHAHKPIVNQNNMLVDVVDDNLKLFYRLYKKMKKRVENVSFPYSKRLLRTRRVLVLPAHVNLTIITNSFDVVHSWFIPGLGLKMDCVPGRATHHVLHIDNVGYYYGQCAEVCGRYHHHMPIRLCALPFEHFLVWWHSFALPKMIGTNDQKSFANYYAFRKYVW